MEARTSSQSGDLLCDGWQPMISFDGSVINGFNCKTEAVCGYQQRGQCIISIASK